MLASASTKHNQSVDSIALYLDEKITMRGHDQTDCNTETDEVSNITALTDREYILLLTSIAQNDKYPQITKNMFIEKMILTHNQCALIPSAPNQLSHITEGAKKTAPFRTLI